MQALSTTTISIALLFASCTSTGPSRGELERAESRIDLANRTARWLDSKAVSTNAGVDWPVDADSDTPRFATNLYSGTPGVILFYLEHHHATKRRRSLELAREGARELWSKVGDNLATQQMGLYLGVAGLAFVFDELHRSTGDESDREMASACLDALLTAARRFEGRTWSNVTDLIGGSAGIGLTLLRFAEEWDHAEARATAMQAGDDLIARSEQVDTFRRWQMLPGYAREMPNFSHGTAGVAYFLARLHEVTGEARFLDGARAGADYLLSITGENGMIHHNQKSPGLHYLGWCHGPPGTARLFTLMHRLTGDENYRHWVGVAAANLARIDLPKVKTAGFWNNHGQCCGTAGVADFFLHVREDTGTVAFDGRIDDLCEALRSSARIADGGKSLYWTGAEHRVQPTNLSSQTGYMQGAAGIGLLFLHDAARLRHAPRRIVLPDSGAARLPHPTEK